MNSRLDLVEWAVQEAPQKLESTHIGKLFYKDSVLFYQMVLPHSQDLSHPRLQTQDLIIRALRESGLHFLEIRSTE